MSLLINLCHFRQFIKKVQNRRSKEGLGGILVDQLALFQTEGGRLCPAHYYLSHPPDFQTSSTALCPIYCFNPKMINIDTFVILKNSYYCLIEIPQGPRTSFLSTSLNSLRDIFFNYCIGYIAHSFGSFNTQTHIILCCTI